VELVPSACPHLSVTPCTRDFRFRECFALNNGLLYIGVVISGLVFGWEGGAGSSQVDLARAVTGRRRRDCSTQRSGCYRIWSEYAVEKRGHWNNFRAHVVVKRTDEKCFCGPVFRTDDENIFNHQVMRRGDVIRFCYHVTRNIFWNMFLWSGG
jgi:hypothetical protein